MHWLVLRTPLYLPLVFSEQLQSIIPSTFVLFFHPDGAGGSFTRNVATSVPKYAALFLRKKIFITTSTRTSYLHKKISIKNQIFMIKPFFPLRG